MEIFLQIQPPVLIDNTVTSIVSPVDFQEMKLKIVSEADKVMTYITADICVLKVLKNFVSAVNGIPVLL